LVLGRLASPRWRATPTEVRTGDHESVLIVGPTQSGKTSCLVVPAILDWRGPVLAASVKDDLVAATAAWRRSQGLVGVFDPHFAPTGLAVAFDPVRLSTTWPQARRLAAVLSSAAAEEAGSVDAQFWSQLASKLLAPLLLAAALGEGSLSTVAHWVDSRQGDEPRSILFEAGQLQAEDALAASLARDERQVSSVYATIEALLEPMITGDPGARCFEPEAFLAGDQTLYLCAPAHDQHRFRPLFAALTSELLQQAFSLARRQGGSLERELLVVLDEAASIAPLKELDVVAATCASHGITLVTCFQDLAQIRARYGERWATVVNNHRSRVFLSGLADPSAGELLSSLTGQEMARRPSHRSRATMATDPPRRLLEPYELRELPAYRGLVVSGRLPPIRLVLRPWWKRRGLQARGPRPLDRGARS
jgi:type IV secretory pathway TraG/TraD family ATPase VirD4